MVRRRPGISLIYCTMIMVAMVAITSLAVDLGRVQLAKTEMRRAATSAARAAAGSLTTTLANVQAIAQQYAQYNSIDGGTIAFNTNSDVAVGTWNATTKTFAAGAFTSATAVQVTLRRTAATSNPIPLLFAKVIGRPTFDLTVTSVATATSGVASTPKMCGLNSVSIHQTAFFASYNSASTAFPSHTNYRTNGVLASNGVIGVGTINTTSQIFGAAVVGPAGSVSANMRGTFTTAAWSQSIPAPAAVSIPAGGYSVDLASYSNYSVSLPGGVYVFDDITAGDGLQASFTGPTTIYLDGNFTAGDSFRLTAYNNVPSNLKIYVSAGHTFTVRNNATMVCCFEAPSAAVVANDNFILQGSLIAKTLSVHDGASLYYDEALGAGAGSQGGGKITTAQ